SSQENAPNSTREKILKHKSLPLVRNNTVTKRTRASYSITQKLAVVDYAVQHGRNMAAVNFNLDATSSNWIAETNNKSKRIGSGQRAFYPEAKKRLYTWIIEQRKQALAVTYEIMQNRMMEILQQPDM
ncbi:6461_t:CDS:2, partial [Racocetra persica]